MRAAHVALGITGSIGLMLLFLSPAVAQAPDGGYRVFRPDGPRPHPAVVFVSGCSGFTPAFAPQAYYPGTLAAKNATQTLPIVMVAVADPVGIGLVASLVRPGGNITGSTLLAGTEIVGKHLELLKEAVPQLARVAVLWNPANSMHGLRLKEVEVAGRSLGVQLQILKAQGPEDLDRAFAAMRRERAGALYVVGDPMFFEHRRRLAELATQDRLPAVYELKEHAEAGGLMAYGPNLLDSYRRAATYADKILNGAKPGDLPVEQPTKFELVVNLKAAKALGLIIPPPLLARADEVIQ